VDDNQKATATLQNGTALLHDHGIAPQQGNGNSTSQVGEYG
jgi:hypothetical protein